MNVFEAYEKYVSLKLHFTKEDYNYLKYGGKTNLKIESFEKRSDKYHFQKLAKKENPMEFLIANFVANNGSVWIGELVNDSKYDDVYIEWKKRKESLKYTFSKDINLLGDNFDEALKVKGGQYPLALQLLFARKISIETICIIDALVNFLPYWDEKILDIYLFKDYSLIIRKYKAFLNVNGDVYRKILMDKFDGK